MRTPLAAVLGLLVSGSALAVVPSPALADHTAAPERVTLVGDLQSELGCADDWAPACDATRLTPVAGTTSYSVDVDVPAGTYAFKVALGSWDESYGADGGADNIPLVLQHDATLTFSYDHETHRVAVAPAAQPTAQVTDADEAMAGTSLRAPLTRERFYFVMADRFANGDPSNDAGGLTGGPLETGLDPSDKGFFHGGDIAGLSDRLDYIEGMGTTAIWLTPSFKNRPVQGAGDQASAGYHGYWVTDFTQIDPHFGTNAELEAFIDEAHDRGIKVFFDIITNHTADVIDYAEDGANTYVSKASSPYRDAAGQEFDDRDVRRWRGRSRELDAATSFPYTPVFRSEADRDGQGAGVAQRPHQLPQPRRLDLRRRVLDVRRLRRPRRPLHRAARRGRRDGRHLQDVGRLRHRRLPHRHRQARQHGVLAGVRPGDAGRGAAGRQRRLLRVRRGLRLQPGLPVELHHRGPPRRHPRLRLPGRGHRLRQGRRDDQAPRLLRRRRLLHRHRLQRVLAADLPRQPRHGPHRHLPRRQRPRPRARPARPRPDVPHPRPAGRLLRRRAGLHRRRRGQGRARRTCSPARSRPTTTTT